ncbi:MAG: hypothetical protein M3401_13355 [Actinomycetota bacterium]|nr:hypothetical protein [Actinomycetota bacterium]
MACLVECPAEGGSGAQPRIDEVGVGQEGHDPAAAGDERAVPPARGRRLHAGARVDVIIVRANRGVEADEAVASVASRPLATRDPDAATGGIDDPAARTSRAMRASDPYLPSATIVGAPYGDPPSHGSAPTARAC